MRERARGGWTPLSRIDLDLPDSPGTARRIRARTAWRAAVGVDLARRLPILDVRQDILVVGLSDPRWQPLLAEMEAGLLRRVRQQRGM